MPASVSRHAYKEVRLQQLRSFCATARLGSLKAAAAALGVAQPTVWEQVHALERVFAAKLVERQAYGCRLTETGRLLAELAAPLVAGIDALPHNVLEARGQVPTQLTVATTQRILVEDLPQSIVEFERRQPQARLRLLELRVEQVAAAVESAQADLGLTVDRQTDPPNPWLVFEPGYDLDLILVTPKNHPLARRRRLRPRDLVGFPLVNSPQGIPDPVITATLEKLGAFRTQPRRVEAFYTAVIRRYVELGFGIGLILGLPGHPLSPQLYERSMSRHFGRVTVNLVWRKGTLPQSPARTFAHTVKTLLKRRGRERRV